MNVISEFQGTKEEAQELGAFYTPNELCNRMVNMVQQSFVGKKVCDNSCGYGNILIAVLNKKVEQGEDASQALTEIYGIELMPENVEVCLNNLKEWAKHHNASWNEEIMRKHIHQGDALEDSSYVFGDEDFSAKGEFKVGTSASGSNFHFGIKTN